MPATAPENVKRLQNSAGVYEIIPGFAAGLVAALVASLASKAPSKEIEKLYDDAVAMKD